MESETFNMQVSIADIIRTSVKLYLDDLNKAYDEKDELKIEITQRSDGNWTVSSKLSAVRIGLLNKEFVKQGKNIDYRKWITLRCKDKTSLC